MSHVLIAHRCDLVRTGLATLIRQMTPHEITGSSSDLNTTFEQSELTRPDILIAELELLTEYRFRCAAMRKDGIAVKLIPLLSNPSDVWQALELRPDALLDGEPAASSIRMALQAVSDGTCFIDMNISEYLVKGDGRSVLRTANTSTNHEFKILSGREQSVLKLIVEGLSNQSIAEELNLSHHTVKVHIKKILRKLDVKDRTQAVLMVLRPSSLLKSRTRSKA